MDCKNSQHGNRVVMCFCVRHSIVGIWIGFPTGQSAAGRKTYSCSLRLLSLRFHSAPQSTISGWSCGCSCCLLVQDNSSCSGWFWAPKWNWSASQRAGNIRNESAGGRAMRRLFLAHSPGRRSSMSEPSYLCKIIIQTKINLNQSISTGHSQSLCLFAKHIVYRRMFLKYLFIIL